MDSIKLKELITIASPQPNGQIPISVKGGRDELKSLLLTAGFDFVADTPLELEKMRKELDDGGSGTVDIDKLVEHLQSILVECLDETALQQAFETFDADNDGKINLEEFEFFMSGFSKEQNRFRDG